MTLPRLGANFEFLAVFEPYVWFYSVYFSELVVGHDDRICGRDAKREREREIM